MPNRFFWMGCAAGLCIVAFCGIIRFSQTRTGASPSSTTEEFPPAASTANRIRVIFAGGLSCEGRERDIPTSAWQITWLSRQLPLTDASPPAVELPADVPGAHPSRLTVRVPGWNEATITLPPPAENGCFYVQEPVALSRKMAGVALTIPALGTDYDIAEIVWVRSLDEEPLALPLGRNAYVPLNFAGTKRLEPLPTGIYRCTLKGRSDARVRDFDLSPELALGTKKDASTPTVLDLPPSLPRTYVGFAGFAADPEQTDRTTGFFCGINVNLRKNTGDLLLAFRPLQHEQSVRYSDLKPRPDTVWPISNLFLQDPVSLSFDCPLSHVDYRMMVYAADGRFTVQPELILPDDERQQKELLGRMRALIQIQARKAAERPNFFDPQYAHLPVQQLPNYENLLSLNNFVRHLTRLSRTPAVPIDLGSQITVRQAGSFSWNVHVDSIHSEPPHP